MKIVYINSCDYGSTGKIMLDLSLLINKMGHIGIPFTKKTINKANFKKDLIYFGSFIENIIHYFISYYTGYNGCFSFIGTYFLIKKLKNINPDIIHLHNLHNWYINLPMLFSYIKKYKKNIVWTLHDCWAFTGQCPYFSIANCDKWKTGCNLCAQYKLYPESKVDKTKRMYNLKKRWFTGINNMTIVTPSQWLANMVKQSFLATYPIKVINNGINLSVFEPTDSKFREKHNIKDKFIILGVAFEWSYRKGLDIFIKLVEKIDQQLYKIVLVGTNERIDKLLPEKIISIHRTHNQTELAEIYTASNVFVNPTREEVFGLVNIEALACGTPVITYNTGGSPECIDPECGIVIFENNIQALIRAIEKVRQRCFSINNCINRAAAFNIDKKYYEYIELYNNIIKNQKDT